jgi:hypothetical protein
MLCLYDDSCYAECYYAACCYIELLCSVSHFIHYYAECHYAMCPYAEFHGTPITPLLPIMLSVNVFNVTIQRPLC